MAEPTEAPKAPETTPVPEWIIPNQDKFEQVIDARLEKLKAEEAPKASRSRAASKDADKPVEPKA